MNQILTTIIINNIKIYFNLYKYNIIFKNTVTYKYIKILMFFHCS